MVGAFFLSILQEGGAAYGGKQNQGHHCRDWW